jgi:hypothetical protein
MRRRREERGGTGRGQFYGDRPATVGRQEGGIREAVIPDFPKKTKCKPICMPGSSFMHIVTYK